MIKAERLTKYYGDRAAIADVSFEINDGEVVGLLGLNGAGKTTTLKTLSGLLLPASGHVILDGIDMAKEPEKARAVIGFLPEIPPLYPDMTVESYLAFVARIKGFAGDLDSAIQDALDATDLEAVRSDFIGTLSNGFQRRVGIAQAIVNRPKLILLDEPTSGLDPRQIVQMRELINGLRGKNTIMISSHILREVEQVCDRVIVMQEGRIVAVGTPHDLASRVTGTTKVRVEIRGAAAELSKALSKAKKYSKHTIDHESEGLTEATVELESDTREELAQTLIESGLGLRQLERVQLELESVFMQLTSTDASPERKESQA